MNRWYASAAIVAVFGASAVFAAPPRHGRAKPAPAPAAAPAPPQPTAADWKPISPDDLLVIDTNKGRIVVEIVPVIAPAHAAQVKALARQHFYDGQKFFRVIDAFMAQTGDPTNTGEGGSTLPNLKGEFTFRRGADAHFVPVAQPGGSAAGFIGVMPVYSQADALMAMTGDGKVSAWSAFCSGVAGMARADDPNSANSQFFLMRQNYPSLEKRYTAWGRVVQGLDVVRAIKTGEPPTDPQDVMSRVRLGSDLPPADRPKLFELDTTSAAFKGQVEAVRQDKGADFSVCDIDVPVRGG